MAELVGGVLRVKVAEMALHSLPPAEAPSQDPVRHNTPVQHYRAEVRLRLSDLREVAHRHGLVRARLRPLHAIVSKGIDGASRADRGVAGRLHAGDGRRAAAAAAASGTGRGLRQAATRAPHPRQNTSTSHRSRARGYSRVGAGDGPDDSCGSVGSHACQLAELRAGVSKGNRDRRVAEPLHSQDLPMERSRKPRISNCVHRGPMVE
mmetsp:Transcript_40434/g.114507  ORF Transcript_40434/g.114507 Transcript_40434/m.114507 type:complete len:207 (-) Transcript_40434:120-740(-)